MDLHVKACPLSAAAKKPFRWTSSPICGKILEAVYSMEPEGLQQAEQGAEAGSGAEVHRSTAGGPHGVPGQAVLVAHQKEQPGKERQAPTHSS